MNRIIEVVFAFLFFCELASFQSCKTYQNVPYFKDVPDSVRISIKSASFKELLIQQGDILNINVMTIDPEANAIFNQAGVSSVASPAGLSGSSSSGASSSAATGSLASINVGGGSFSGYVVDKHGDVELPLLGKFRAEGLSTDSLKNLVQSKAEEYYKTPAVTVRIANLKVNVLGEVTRPGSYILTNEKNTIFDALSMASDLTIFGRRENVLLIRDSAGITKMTRFSLNSKDLVSQDFFYLKQNDVIYVEPMKGKAAAQDADKSRLYALIASIVTVIVVVASRL